MPLPSLKNWTNSSVLSLISNFKLQTYDLKNENISVPRINLCEEGRGEDFPKFLNCTFYMESIPFNSSKDICNSFRLVNPWGFSFYLFTSKIYYNFKGSIFKAFKTLYVGSPYQKVDKKFVAIKLLPLSFPLLKKITYLSVFTITCFTGCLICICVIYEL